MRIRKILSSTIAIVGTVILAACSDPLAAPAEMPGASFARKPGTTPGGNESCSVDGGTRKSGDKKDKNACEPTVQPVVPSFKFVNNTGTTLSANVIGYKATPCGEDTEVAGVFYPDFTADDAAFVNLCLPTDADPSVDYNVRITAAGIASVTPADRCIKGGDPAEWLCNIRTKDVTITLEAPAAPSFAGFAFFYTNTVLGATECAQYGTLCQSAKTAAGGDGNIRQIHVDIHGVAGALGAPVIPRVGFNSALLTKVAFRSFADGSESLVVTPGAGFYYTSQYFWTVYIAKPGFAPTSFFDPNFAVSDPTGPKGSHYVSVTYNGTDYNYLIINYN